MSSEIIHPRIDEISELLSKAEKLVQTNLASCLSCGFFVEKTENCNKFGGRPPARVIAFSCPAYEFIPF